MMPAMCNICGIRPSKIHFTEIVNDNLVTMDLCLECAEEKGIDTQKVGTYGLGDLVAGLIDDSAETDAERIGKVRCPQCGFDYSDFKRIGRFGCPECYRAFEAQLVTLLRQIHGSTQHVGQKPERLSSKAMLRKELSELAGRLSKAVEKEEYEEAARLRDRIRELEAKVKEP
jgi:protein arginine kinase activator